MRDYAPALVVVAVVALIIFGAWYGYRYPCIQYQARYVEAWTEIRHVSCGKDCDTIVPIYHPAHWTQDCVARGDRHKGDVEAPSAPIPGERSW